MAHDGGSIRFPLRTEDSQRPVEEIARDRFFRDQLLARTEAETALFQGVSFTVFTVRDEARAALTITLDDSSLVEILAAKAKYDPEYSAGFNNNPNYVARNGFTNRPGNIRENDHLSVIDPQRVEGLFRQLDGTFHFSAFGSFKPDTVVVYDGKIVFSGIPIDDIQALE